MRLLLCLAAALLASCGTRPPAYWPTEPNADDVERMVDIATSPDAELDTSDRWAAASALPSDGPLRASVRPRLIAALDHTNEDVRWAALKALQRVGWETPDALPRLIAIVADSNEEDAARAEAIELLARRGPAAVEAVPVLLEALNDPELILIASRIPPALARIAPDDEAVFNAVVAHVDLDEVFGADDLHAVAAFGERGLPYLRSVFLSADSADTTIWVCAAALGRLGAAAGPTLTEGLRSKRTFTRRLPAPFLAQARVPAEEAIQLLVPLLDEDDTSLRSAAVRGLANYGTAARPVVPRLETLLSDPAPQVRVQAAAALIAIENEVTAALPVLRDGLRSDSYGAQTRAAEVLAKIAPTGREALPDLEVMLADRWTDVRRSAAAAIAAHGPAASRSVPALLRLARLEYADNPADCGTSRMEGRDDSLIAAARALQAIGPKARAALPELRAMLDAYDRGVRNAAGRAIETIDP